MSEELSSLIAEASVVASSAQENPGALDTQELPPLTRKELLVFILFALVLILGCGVILGVIPV